MTNGEEKRERIKETKKLTQKYYSPNYNYSPGGRFQT